jgi:hypothetical protein
MGENRESVREDGQRAGDERVQRGTANSQFGRRIDCGSAEVAQTTAMPPTRSSRGTGKRRDN